uniref:Uncharacterized protein n=1 Tax=Micrococcus phage Kurnik TaxID=3092208 RepID=A0AAU6R686_9CAUD
MARKGESSSAAKSAKQPKVIKYVGTADVKIYDGFEWNSQNEYTVPVDAVDESTLEHLRSQPDFRVV